MDRNEFLKKNNILDYFIDDFDRICVNRNVLLNSLNLIEIPFQFGNIKGDFNVSDNQLISLKCSPIEVSGTFDCSLNQLTSLEYAPSVVNGDFYCYMNKLISLKGCPSHINGSFIAAYNRLRNLDGCPEDVYGLFDVSFNQIDNFDFFPMTARAGFYSDFEKGLDYFKNKFYSKK